MTADRIKEIQMASAYPNSQSVQQALLQVWNECIQERMYSEEDLKKAIDLARVFSKITENDGYDEFEYTPIEIIQQFKNK